MRKFYRLAALALGAASFATAASADSGVKVGTLTCHVEGGWGYVLGSSKNLHCEYNGTGGTMDRYAGSFSKFGVDIGYTKGATLVWAVIAPTTDVGPGALAGDYVGGTASATLIGGVGAHGLVGGLDRSFALQPLSVEGNSGYFDVAAGVGAMHLREVGPPPPPRILAEVPPPPPPPPRPKHFLVFFDFNRAELTPEARKVVALAVNTAEVSGMVRIHVTGHTDTVGSDSYNQKLSIRRAEAVKADMVHDGLHPVQIAVEGRSFHDPLIPTGHGVREPQNRRAVIDLSNPVVGQK